MKNPAERGAQAGAAELEVKEVLESSPTRDIVLVEGSSIPVYMVKSPQLTPAERAALSSLKEKLVDEIKIEPGKIPLEEREKVFVREGLKVIERVTKEIPSDRKKFLLELIANEMVGYGPLAPMLADDNLEDVMIIGLGAPVHIFHQKYGMCATNVYFRDEHSIMAIIDKASRDAGRRIDLRQPLIDSRMPDGNRLNIIIPPISLTGPILSIRKFKSTALSVLDLIKLGTLSTDSAAFLWLLVEGMGVRPANMLFAGGTGCGKTTTLGALSSFVPERERVITIEDAAELKLPHRHWIRLETRLPVEALEEVTVDQLVRNSLRMRPDRLIIGEARGLGIPTVFTAFSGHTGCMCTIHSNTTAEETLARLTRPPISVPELLISAVDAIVMQRRLLIKNKYIRRVTEIAEVVGVEGGKVKLNRTHKWNPGTDEIRQVDTPSLVLQQISELSGIPQKDILKELKRREEVLKLMLGREMDVFSVNRAIQDYYSDPDGALEVLERQRPPSESAKDI